MIFPKGHIVLFFALAVAMLLGCEKNDMVDSNDLSTKIVVEGYVFANEPVDAIHVSKVNSTGTSQLIPVVDATVKINQGGNIIQLIDSSGVSGIYAQDPSSSYILPDSGSVKLRIVLADKTYTSNTSFPSKLNGLLISNNQISLISGNSTQTVATLSWNPVLNAAGYCIFMRNISENSLPASDGNMQTSVFHRVIYSNSLDLKSTDFTYTGTYDLYVTAVNEDYAAMYSYGGANNLISGSSNIENGWGIFTAFNGMAVSVTVQ